MLLVIPNFINRDINEQVAYDQKERFYPGLARINSIDKLEKYVDATASLKKIDTRSSDYTSLLAYIISCRFYHGFSHWKLNENWIAALGEKVIGYGLACKVEPDKIMMHPNAACSQQALVMMEILRRKNIPYRKVGFPHHYALEVNINKRWYFFDPNMEPDISISGRLEENWKGSNDSLKKYYNSSIHSNLDYQFGNKQMAVFGSVNEIPAQRAKLFQQTTAILSKYLWCIPLLFIFVKRRRPGMYAVKPVNHKPVSSFPVSENLNPVYSARVLFLNRY
jgi:hypothetical protein